ncbi:MAG: 3-hydroxyacyl-CoA dehydrogenase family protein [Candidatus Lokiarchaeia archaeon]|nr:3-hydroxyacyl-CoA dehydrogenase family protein [Candidatus Lokiarchaeia archaeon]
MGKINDINRVAVIGAGTMGHEIAQVALMGGLKHVILNDLNGEILELAEKKIHSNLIKLESKGLLKEGYTASSLMGNLKTEIDLKKSISNVDFIFEAIPEKMKLKQELFEKLGTFAPKHVILATNTSTMSITKIASLSGRPDKVIGCHFFTPIVVLRLIEIIKGKETSEETIEITKNLCNRLPALKGKRLLPILQKESPGFIVNRLMLGTTAYINWLLDYAMEKEIPLETLDADVKEIMKIGPFAKWDYLGLDVIYNTMKYFEKVVSTDFAPGKTLKRLVNEGKLGRKTGEGLFKWINGKPLINLDKKANILNLELFLAIQLNEGCKLLEEGVVSGYKIIDDTMLAGMDIPGPFGVGKKKYKEWTNLLDNFVRESNLHYFTPCQLMKSGKFIQMRK